MTELLSFTHWTWLTIAIGLLILEALAPGVVFVWLAIAAGIVGVLLLIIPMSWEFQIVLFGVLAIASVLAGRRYVSQRPIESEDETLNRRGQQYIGHVYDVVVPIRNGVGKIKVGDTLWRAEGADADEGAKVRVTASENTSLVVEAID